MFISVHLRDLALANLFDALHLEIVLLGSGFGKLSQTSWVADSHASTAAILQLLVKASQRDRVLLLQHNELVWDDTHLLESDCLDFSSRETFDDPTSLFLFHELHLHFHKLDDDFILHVAVSLTGLLNLDTVVRMLGHLLVDEVTDRDAGHGVTLLLKMVSQCQSNFLSLASWRPDEDDSAGYNSKD